MYLLVPFHIFSFLSQDHSNPDKMCNTFTESVLMKYAPIINMVTMQIRNEVSSLLLFQ